MNESPRSGCLRNGCIGCLTALAILVGLIFLLSALRMISTTPEPTPESRRFERELPEPPPLPGPESDRPPPIEGVELPPATDAESPPSGVLVLDLSVGEFRIVPGPAGEPIRVQADYDTSSFDLTEQYDTHPDGGWTWRVEFGSKHSFLGMLLAGGDQGGGNRVEIVVPRGQPLSIVGKIGTGESEIDLGGLWIERIDLELGIGEHFLEVREPLPVAAEEIAISSSIGDVELRDLGNASPRRLRIEHDVGELYVDLQGSWRGDAEVEIDSGVGGTRIELPHDARVELPRAGVGLGEKTIDREEIAIRNDELPEDAPTVRLSVSAGIGEVRIGR